MIYISIILFLLAGLAKGEMNTIQFHFGLAPKWMKPKYWNPTMSWKNKYKNGDKRQGEKFLFSTNLFVFVTDGWHLLQFIFLNSLSFGAALLYSNNFIEILIAFIILRGFLALGSILTYKN